MQSYINRIDLHVNQKLQHISINVYFFPFMNSVQIITNYTEIYQNNITEIYQNNITFISDRFTITIY